jgi:hypothetical protein
MKIKLTVIIVLFLSSFETKAQKVHEISLKVEYVNLMKGGFYIDSIIDDRAIKDDIGFVKKGFFSKVVRAKLSGGLLFTLEHYFNYCLSNTSDNVPLVLKVSKFKISEKTELSAEYAEAEITFDYYFQDKLLYTSNVSVSTKSLDVTKLHEANIRDILKRSLRHFDRTNWEDKLVAEQNLQDTLQFIKVIVPEVRNEQLRVDIPYSLRDEPIHEIPKSKGRNSVTIGYQIGGFTILGIDYEVRVSDYFGIHFGGGFAGYTAGLKVHTGVKKSSPFFNINYKDGGFGLLKTGGLEFGGCIPFSRRKDLGIHLQAGLGKVLAVDDVLVQRLFNSTVPPDYMFTFGIGLGW